MVVTAPRVADPMETVGPGRWARLGARSLYLPTIVIAAASGWLAWYGWGSLRGYGPINAIRAGQLDYAGPAVLGFVAVVLVLERIWPVQERPLLARGHRLDFGYLVAYALVVLPLVTLLGAGAATLLERHASWLVLPQFHGLSRWGALVLGLLVIDATDWFVHLINHKLNPLWRLHAVHHSQEELSVLTTFRAHPLVHLSFVLTAIPGFVLAANAATPVTLLTAYACLGALPHANLRWGYGRIGRVVISPAYHRAHHRTSGRLDVNLGVVFAIWDTLSGRAIFPAPRTQSAPIATGLAGRPIPIEQAGDRPRLMRTFVVQWLEPFRRLDERDAA